MGKLIVAIEDDEYILDIFNYILTKNGYNVKGYNSIKHLDQIIADNPDLILLDGRLADSSGDELCRLIKAHQLTKHIPVILVSGASDIKAYSKACGADSYIAKPFELDKLVVKVRKYVS